MRRIGAVIVIGLVMVVAKFGGLPSFSWEQLRVLAELAGILLVYSLVKNPVTHFIDRPLPSPHLRKMLAIRYARNSRRPLRFHLKSGEMRQGFVATHSFDYGTFSITDQFEDGTSSEHKYYDIHDVDELIFTLRDSREISLENSAAESAT